MQWTIQIYIIMMYMSLSMENAQYLFRLTDARRYSKKIRQVRNMVNNSNYRVISL